MSKREGVKDKRVVKFLNDHGYYQTSHSLTNENQQYLGEEMKYFTSLFKAKSSSLILNKNITKQRNIIKQFSSLKEFVTKNDEIYCSELNQILFPIFVYSYLYLIKRQDVRESQLLVKKFESFFYHSKHQVEYKKLKEVKKFDDFYTNDFAKKSLKEKFIIMLSKESFELLLKFFEDKQFFLFKSFSNRYINFIISSNLPEDQKEVVDKMEIEDENIPILDETKEKYHPSIFFYTFLGNNDENKPNNVKINDKLIVSGYNNSSIKLNYLTNLNLCSELVGHYGPVYNFDVSNNNNWLLSCGEDSTVRLWNLKKNKQVVVYRGHSLVVWDVKFCDKDNNVFASCSNDKTARLYVTNRVVPIRIFAGHSSDVEVVKFHPAGNFIATASNDKTIRLWDIQNGNCIRIFIGHKHSINTIEFHPNGKYILSADESGLILKWSLTEGKIVSSFNEHFLDITSIKFKNDSYFVSCSLDFSVKVWNFEKKKSVHSFNTKNTPVYSVNILKNNVILAAGVHSKLIHESEK